MCAAQQASYARLSVSLYKLQAVAHQSSPHCATVTDSLGLLLLPVGTFSIFLTVSMPSIT